MVIMEITQCLSSNKAVNKLSKDMVGQTETVSAATEEQSATMEEMAASSMALAYMAADLTQAVSKFKI